MSIDPEQIRVEAAVAGGRYVYRFADGSEAEMAYSAKQPGVVIITHTGTPPAHRGQGVAAALVAKAVTDFRAAELKVVPSCWFAREQFDAHPQWSDLLFRE